MIDDEEKEKIKQEQEWKDRIEYYEESKHKISKKLEETEGREKEAIRYRMSCCQNLIDDYRTKLNPTGKKEMYK